MESLGLGPCLCLKMGLGLSLSLGLGLSLCMSFCVGLGLGLSLGLAAQCWSICMSTRITLGGTGQSMGVIFAALFPNYGAGAVPGASRGSVASSCFRLSLSLVIWASCRDC